MRPAVTQSPILFQNSPVMPFSSAKVSRSRVDWTRADGGQQVAVRGNREELSQGRHLRGGEPALELVFAAAEDALDPAAEVVAEDGHAAVFREGDGPPHGAVFIADICQNQRRSLLVRFIHMTIVPGPSDGTAGQAREAQRSPDRCRT